MRHLKLLIIMNEVVNRFENSRGSRHPSPSPASPHFISQRALHVSTTNGYLQLLLYMLSHFQWFLRLNTSIFLRFYYMSISSSRYSRNVILYVYKILLPQRRFLALLSYFSTWGVQLLSFHLLTLLYSHYYCIYITEIAKQIPLVTYYMCVCV